MKLSLPIYKMNSPRIMRLVVADDDVDVHNTSEVL
jgi:hypothetical protein